MKVGYFTATKETGERIETSQVRKTEGSEQKESKHQSRFKRLLFILTLGLILSITYSVMLGPVPISMLTVWKIVASQLPFVGDMVPVNWTIAQQNIIWELRFPRALLGGIVGAGLAVAGVGIQALVRNSLADPYILGVSSGASVGATLVILFGALQFFGQYALSLAAFLGAFLSVVFVYTFARVGGQISTIRLLLAGIAISMILGAVTNVIVLSAPEEEGIRGALYWMMGSLAGANWTVLPIPTVAVVVVFVFLLYQSRTLNLILMGEDTAATLGINVGAFRKVLIVVISLLTGVLVAVSGAIGFVGLMVPHMIRLLVGSDHRRVLPISALFGAVFMIWADIVARLVVAPEELPIGVVTALCGGPFFILLLRRSSYTFGGRS